MEALFGVAKRYLLEYRLERLNLAATGQGVGMQPLSQALQEYPEMGDLYRDIHERLAPGGGTVQMFGRIGYGPDVPQSPRWPVESKIVNA